MINAILFFASLAVSQLAIGATYYYKAEFSQVESSGSDCDKIFSMKTYNINVSDLTGHLMMVMKFDDDGSNGFFSGIWASGRRSYDKMVFDKIIHVNDKEMAKASFSGIGNSNFLALESKVILYDRGGNQKCVALADFYAEQKKP